MTPEREALIRETWKRSPWPPRYPYRLAAPVLFPASIDAPRADAIESFLFELVAGRVVCEGVDVGPAP